MADDVLHARLSRHPPLKCEDEVTRHATQQLKFKDKADRYLSRAREVLQSGDIRDIACSEDGKEVTARVHERGYAVSIDFHATPVEVQCSCPSGEKDPLCKHGLALLLWRTRELQLVGEGPAHVNEEQDRRTNATPNPTATGPQTLAAGGSTGVSARGRVPGSNPGPAGHAVGGLAGWDGRDVRGNDGGDGVDATGVVLTQGTGKRRLPSAWLRKPPVAGAKAGAASPSPQSTPSKATGTVPACATPRGATSPLVAASPRTEPATKRHLQPSADQATTPRRRDGPPGAHVGASSAGTPKTAQATPRYRQAKLALERTRGSHVGASSARPLSPGLATPRRYKQGTLTLTKTPSKRSRDSEEPASAADKGPKKSKVASSAEALSPVRCSPRAMLAIPPSALLEQARTCLAGLSVPPGPAVQAPSKATSPPASAALLGFSVPPNVAARSPLEACVLGTLLPPPGSLVQNPTATLRMTQTTQPLGDLPLQSFAPPVMREATQTTQPIGELSPRSHAARERSWARATARNNAPRSGNASTSSPCPEGPQRVVEDPSLAGDPTHRRWGDTDGGPRRPDAGAWMGEATEPWPSDDVVGSPDAVGAGRDTSHARGGEAGQAVEGDGEQAGGGEAPWEWSPPPQGGDPQPAGVSLLDAILAGTATPSKPPPATTGS